MDRIQFFKSVQGIEYPSMLVDFFDHIVALKQIVEDSGNVNVLSHEDNKYIEFSIHFKNKATQTIALNTIYSLNGSVVIYQHPMAILTSVPTDTDIIIKLFS